MKQGKDLITGLETNDVFDGIRSLYAISAQPKLVVDWNLNRYSTPTAENIPSEDLEGYDIETFPIESIIEPIRPNKGIAKAIVGQAIVSPSYQEPHGTKFYIGDEADIYKYWVSPYPTDGTSTFPLHTDGLTTVRPHVLYSAPVKANKIVVRLETSWATPDSFKIFLRSTVGTGTDPGWTQAGATSPAIDSEGVVTLYYNGFSWSSAKPLSPVTTDVAGIMLHVDTMTGGTRKDGTATFYTKRDAGTGEVITHYTDGSNSNLALISIEAHFEDDLTDRLVSVSDTFEMAESNQLYPIGTITTNQAQVTLSNDDGYLNNENIASPYYKLLDRNVEFNLEYIYSIDEKEYSVQQFKMYSSNWTGQSSEAVTVELDDFSKFLKETKPLPALYEGKSSTEIVWRILDSVGFNDYEIDESDLEVEHTIPFFWSDGEKTVWELFDEIAQATQTAIYFDSRGKLQVKTRAAAFKDASVVDWELLGQNDGTSLEDIVSIDQTEEFEANDISVKFKSTKWKTALNGKPALSKVWEPSEDSVVVRSSPLFRSLNSGDNFIWLTQQDAKIWPYSGKVNIDGEIISYEGKQYVYYTYTESISGGGVVTYSNPVKNVVLVKDNDEFKNFESKTPLDHRNRNRFTGGLKVKERGLWNTEEKGHEVEANQWATELDVVASDGSLVKHIDNARGFKFNRRESTVTINTPWQVRHANDTFWASRLAVASNPFIMYGTKLKFNRDAASTTQRGGIAFSTSGARNEGYYVELRLSSGMTGTVRKRYSEVMIYSKKGNTYHVVAKGAPTAIGKNIWYDVDVRLNRGTQDTIHVWVNGKKVASGTTTATTKQSDSGRISMYARGKTNMDFEFIYGLTKVAKEPADDFGFYDLLYGGVRGGFYEREVVWRLKTRWKKIRKRRWTKETFRWNDFFFDEFGPYVHEVREFDVKFDPSPVQYSTLFSTNEWHSATIEYTADPFSAKFIVANTSRNNAILNGEDRIVFRGAGQEVNQVLTVLGRNLEIADEETVRKKNEKAIRANGGPVEVELSSEWIQSKAMAENLAVWMAKHWSEGADQASAVIFGNPLIEIGDVVSVSYDDNHMSPETHKYFVVGTSSSFDTGLETTLTLRRVRETPEEDIS